MAPFLWLFNYNPVGPAVMVGLFGVATVWLVYKTGKEFFNASVGLVAAFLYSISPVVIAYSRSSWNPNLMPFFTLLALYVLYKAVNRKGAGGKEFIVCGILLGILMQLHYLATFVVFIAGVYVLVTGVLRYKMYDAGIKNILRSYVLHLISLFLGFLIGFSPFLAFEVRHGFPNIISIFKFIFQSQEVSGSGDFFLTIQNVFFRLFGRLVTAFPPPEQISVQAHQDLMIWYICTWILALASFGYFVYMFIKGTKGWVLLFLWFTIGIFLFGFYRKQIYDYYFGFLFPLPFLFVSVFLAFLWQKKIYFKIIAVVIFLGLTYRNLQG